MKVLHPKQTLSVKVPKHFYIPSIQSYITAGQYVAMYKKCKANPGQNVERTISQWWGGTTDDVLNEMRQAIHERIYLRQFIN